MHSFSRSSQASLVTFLGALLIVGCNNKSQSSQDQQQTRQGTGEFPVAELGSFYQARGELEMDRFAEAEQLFQKVIAAVPDEPAAHANLAVALLGQQKDQAAADAAERAVKLKDTPTLRLIRGQIAQAAGNSDVAEADLRAAFAEDPALVEARWRFVELLRARGSTPTDETLIEQYDWLARYAPDNLAAVLAAARAAADAENVAMAQRHFDRARVLIGEPPAAIAKVLADSQEAFAAEDVAEIRRTIAVTENVLRATDRFRADALKLAPLGERLPSPLSHPLLPLSDSATAAIEATIAFERVAADELAFSSEADVAKRKLAVGVVGSDRLSALLVTDSAAPPRLWVRSETTAGLRDATTDFGLENAKPNATGRFFDFNNDRLLDIIFVGEDGVTVWQFDADSNKFVEKPAATAEIENEALFDYVPFDVDHDGDLDLLAWSDAALRVIGNNGAGAFLTMNVPTLPPEIAKIVAILPRDFDDDGDIDLLVMQRTDAGFQWRMWQNNRRSQFVEISDDLGFVDKTFGSVPAVGDVDNDGWYELIEYNAGVDQKEIIRHGFAAEWNLEAETIAKTAEPIHQLQVADIDNDGGLNAVWVSKSGAFSWSPSAIKAGADFSPESIDAAAGESHTKTFLAMLDLNQDGLLDGVSADGVIYQNKTENAGHWLTVGLEANIDGDSRFNAFGYGSDVEVRCGPLYQKRFVDSPLTHFGLGPHPKVDVLRILWPNGSYQNLSYRVFDRMAIAGDQVLLQEQSLKGSCPYLYVWNGERFEFVTDVLWRSALGMPLAADVLGHHWTSDDYFKVPRRLVQPKDGAFVFQFVEELWETPYFDWCRLYVVDHPADVEIYLDESCRWPPYPQFEVFPVATPLVPRVETGTGGDVTELLRGSDQQYVRDFELTQYQGIAKPHELIFHLDALKDRQLDKPPTIRLFLEGWVMPTDATINTALMQHPRLNMQLPKVETIGADGEWRSIQESVGFPSGKSKTVVINLSNEFPSDDFRVRLSTNMCLFWDRAFYTVNEPQHEMTMTELPVQDADLHWRGFSLEYPRVPYGPTIPDYEVMDHSRAWRDLEGMYTRYGDVTELLAERDGRYIISNAGDEITLRFSAADLPPLPDGWTRDYVIHTDGWLKDGDLTTVSGQTVGPLPFHGMKKFPYAPEQAYPDDPALREYHEKYNTRRIGQSEFRAKVRGVD